MKNAILLFAAAVWLSASAAGPLRHPDFRESVPRDSILLSDPCVVINADSTGYCMTGTGGLLYKSSDLERWNGPYIVAMTDSTSWMGPRPAIWAAEIHPYNGKYYYFATFTNDNTVIDRFRGMDIPRRACHVLVSDTPDGPFYPMADSIYTPADKATLDGTLWVEPDGTPYMVFCGEWIQNWNGTVEKMQLKPDLSGAVSAPEVLFRASDNLWSRETVDGVRGPNRVTDGPWLFRTGTGRLGMLWTSWIDNVYTQGVAYSQSGTIDGPWIQEPEPVTPPDFGHAMLFRDLDGQWLMSVHSHYDDHGRYIRVPHFFKVDLSGDRLVVGEML